jgi:hypothetical protein
LYFSDVPLSRDVAPQYNNGINVTLVLLEVPQGARWGSWKNLLILQHMGSPETLSRFERNPGSSARAPLWFVIVDDDTYLLGPAVEFSLRGATKKIREEVSVGIHASKRSKLYLGHTVIHCERCRHPSKRFPFAFGGNGIFMSSALLHSIAKWLPGCIQTLRALPGDVQIGGCIARSRLANLIHLSVGTEQPPQAFGDKIDVVMEHPFPFSFHRIKDPGWAEDLFELERRHPRRILLWADIAPYYLIELGPQYNRRKLIFRETWNDLYLSEPASSKKRTLAAIPAGGIEQRTVHELWMLNAAYREFYARSGEQRV